MFTQSIPYTIHWDSFCMYSKDLVFNMYGLSRSFTWGRVQEACPWMQDEGTFVGAEWRCYTSPEDWSLLAGNIHQPDRTEQSVSFHQSVESTQIQCGNLLCDAWKNATAHHARCQLLASLTHWPLSFLQFPGGMRGDNHEKSHCNSDRQFDVWKWNNKHFEKLGAKFIPKTRFSHYNFRGVALDICIVLWSTVN